MCGIAGALYRDSSTPSESVLRAMATTLAHRGPDGAGVRTWPGVGLAHRRLSIIDPSPAAGQPMATADGAAWVVFNGEIYNFAELRERLEKLGHSFHTQGDTEVLLAAYRQWGEDCFAQLDGMFALALWDTQQRRLILARDRTGKKPLYVYEDSSKLLFASEMKALFAHADVDSSLSPEAVPQFLTHGYVPTPRTFYRRVRKLRPSTYEVFDSGRRESRAVQYWDLPVGPERQVSLEEVKAELRQTFFAAVKRRMVADVPLGAFLSGGVDSTLVVAAMAQSSSKPVKTFSIGFEGHPEWDETKWAAEVAQRYGCEHTEFKVSPESFDLLEKLSWHYDEPFGDSSAIPTYIVSKLTREKVTVALTGDGGDELFCGYPRFMGAVLAEKVPRVLRTVAGRLVGLVPHGQVHQGWYERGRRFADQAAEPLADRLRGWVSIFPARDLHALLKPDINRFATAPILGESYMHAFKKAQGADTLNQVLYANARTYLLDDLNVKMDRASMAASLEARAPFLDTQLMELAFRLPGSLKLRGRTMKWVLKEALGDLLPGDVATRKKMGFGVPLGAWFRGGLSDQLDERLLKSGARIHDFVRPMELRRLVAEHRAGHRDWGLQFFNLLMLELFLSRRASA